MDFKSIKNTIKEFILNEDGNESVEMAILFPIVLIIVGFIMDRFIQYEGVTAVSSAANEAIRYAIVEKNNSDGKDVALETLKDRMQSSKLGWCKSNDNSTCKQWKSTVKQTSKRADFEKDNSYQFLFTTDKGWCNGSYLTLGVRAHKSSIMPSYESFRQLITKGGPIYHQHTYIITARVESNKKC